MELLTPNYVYTANEVKVCEKIIPDGTCWEDDSKALRAGCDPGTLYKKEYKLNYGTGRPKYVTIHNTDDIKRGMGTAERYTRAVYNEDVGLERVHFYVDNTCAWQNLKAGTNMTPNDPAGSAEVGCHAGDEAVSDSGDTTSLSIEIIMDSDSGEQNAEARDNGARLAAWLLWKYGLGISKLVTHIFWINKAEGKYFQDIDWQCITGIRGKKRCPAYILGSTDPNRAFENWRSFKELVGEYLNKLYCAGKCHQNTEIGIFSPYLVKVSEKLVNVQNGPGDGFARCGSAAMGVYTIIAERYDKHGKKWGKLKSGSGWIALEKTENCNPPE